MRKLTIKLPRMFNDVRDEFTARPEPIPFAPSWPMLLPIDRIKRGSWLKLNQLSRFKQVRVEFVASPIPNAFPPSFPMLFYYNNNARKDINVVMKNYTLQIQFCER